MKREIGDYVEDIIDAMDKAMEFVKEMSYDEFIRDDKSSFAFGYLSPFEFVSGDKPGVIRIGEQYIYVVLPMQTT